MTAAILAGFAGKRKADGRHGTPAYRDAQDAPASAPDAGQKLLAENVANADTPGFQPRELRAPSFTPAGTAAARAVAVERTNAGHMTLAAARAGEEAMRARPFETTPSGNAVNLEEEMMKVAQNQSDYQLAASLYQKSLQMLRTAVGRGGR